MQFRNAYYILIFACIAFGLGMIYFFHDDFVRNISGFKYFHSISYKSFQTLTEISATNKSKPLLALVQNNNNSTNSTSKPSLIYNNIVIIQLTNDKRNKVYAESIRNKQIYSSMHNYTLFVDEPGKERHAVWYKCISVLKAFNQTKADDWVWMLDSDTIITNMNIELHRLISYANQKNFHIIISKDCNNINAGSILYRNSQLSVNFVQDVWNSLGKEVVPKDEWREQRGTIIMAERPAYKEHILYVPQNSINSYPNETKCQIDREWRVGDFVIHFAGNHNERLFFKYVDISNRITKDNLKLFNTDNWLNYVNGWRIKNNFTSIF